MSPAEFAENMHLALSPLAADKQELFRRLDALTPQGAALHVEAVASFFRILREADVPADKLKDRFAQIATEHLQLKEGIRRFRVTDPEVQGLRDDASAALDRGDHDAARTRLAQARNLVRSKREAVAKVLSNQQREEATLVREQAKVEAARLRFAESGRLYEEAAGLLPEADLHQRWQDLIDAGARWSDQGRDFDDNAALIQVTAVLKRALELKPRASFGLAWATGKYLLGNALQARGELESGKIHLEEAVYSYRAALEEWTEQRVPMWWAVAQNGLANTLQVLGQRELGTAQLKEADDAYRAALKQWTRQRAPMDWALVQNNRGNNLTILGELESDTTRLEEALDAYHAALEEWTRQRAPKDWAMIQNNIGNVLAILGEREDRTAKLKEAADAYRAALEERTRGLVPSEWASTQYNLGMVLQGLGVREGGTTRLKEAVAAYRAALEEKTRQRAPRDWAMIQHNLANALWFLGQRESSTKRLKEALVAYQAALEEITQKSSPLQWANIQYNLALALEDLSEWLKEPLVLRAAVQTVRVTVRVLREGEESYLLPRVQASIARMERKLADATLTASGSNGRLP